MTEKTKANPQEIELKPDAWSRFERAVDVVAKSPPQHKAQAGKNPKRQKSKGERSSKR